MVGLCCILCPAARMLRICTEELCVCRVACPLVGFDCLTFALVIGAATPERRYTRDARQTQQNTLPCLALPYLLRKGMVDSLVVACCNAQAAQADGGDLALAQGQEALSELRDLGWDEEVRGRSVLCIIVC